MNNSNIIPVVEVAPQKIKLINGDSNYCNDCGKEISPDYEICLSCHAKMMDEQAGGNDE